MKMIRPRLEAPQISIAEEQVEYRPVVGALVLHRGYPCPYGKTNAVVVAYQPSEDERQRLAAGEAIYLSFLTFGGPLQAHIVHVGAAEPSAIYNVREEAPRG